MLFLNLVQSIVDGTDIATDWRVYKFADVQRVVKLNFSNKLAN